MRDPLLATVVPGRAWHHENVLLVAGPRSDVGGRVVDDRGVPVVGARLVVETAQSLYQRLGVRRPLVVDPVPVPTGAGGTFVLEGVCTGAGVFVAATHDGHERVRAELVDVPAGGLEIVLPRLAQELTGTVLDALGAPVAEASVSLGEAIATTAADGSFHVRHDGLEGGATLVALKRGHLPGRVELHGPPSGPVVVQIGEPPLAIEGRVVDAAGEPIAGAIVWLRDPTPFGHEAHELDEFTVAMTRSVEDLLGSERGATADERGRFRLGGLLPRVYDVQAFDPRTYSLGTGWRIDAATTGAELVLSPEPGVRRVAGRVTSLGGEPVAGVSIVPTRTHLADVHHLPPVQAQIDPAAVTDDEGRFDIAALAAEGTVLQLHHARLGPFRQHEIGPDEDPEDLHVELPLPCRFQVDLADRPDFADGLRVLDADGAPLRLLESFGAFLTHREEAELVGGRSSVLESDERARTLVLLRGDEEVLRVPIALSTDESTTLRP